MINYKNRTGLVLSVSVAALCIAMPASAQMTTTVLPGATLPDEFAFPLGETFTSGVTATGSPAATANVVEIASGTITQGEPSEEHADEPVVVPEVIVLVEEEPFMGTGIVVLSNAGTVSILADATATNDEAQAIANASVSQAIGQYVAAPLPEVSATATNTGVLTIGSTATATGTIAAGEGESFGARAKSSLEGGFHQEAGLEENTDGTATTTIINNGSYAAFSTAAASAESDADASATLTEALYARASGNGGSDASTFANLINSGLLDFKATATGTSTAGDATAVAEAGGGEHGVVQIRARTNGRGIDTSDVTINNQTGGTMAITALANATAAGLASATAFGGDGYSTVEGAKGVGIGMLGQSSGVDNGDITVTLTNAGQIRLTYTANATSTGAAPADGEMVETPPAATATSGGNGLIKQSAEAGGTDAFLGRTGLVSLTNASGGTIAITAAATAASAGASIAAAELGAGVYQTGSVTGTATANFSNAGTMTVGSNAVANGATAIATSAAEGVRQSMIAISGANAGFANSGSMTVAAAATATGSSSAEASANALGYAVVAEPLALTVSSSGAFTVNATATAAGVNIASATGMQLFANIDPTTLPPESGGGNGQGGGGQGGGCQGDCGNGSGGEGGGEEPVDIITTAEVVEDPYENWTNLISGTVANSGTVNVTASALGASSGAEANALGVHFEAAVNTATFTNSGTIRASAITNGGASSATGILVTDFAISPILPGETDRMTIANNGGSIIARVSSNGGSTWQHGTAIDTTLAPNPVDMRFTGTSSVYGNIKTSAADTMTVVSGTTTLDGTINPFEGSLNFASIDRIALEPVGPLVGSLTVASGATLYLVDQPRNNPNYDGPASVNVDSFTLASGSTLQLQLPSNNLAAPAQAAYPFINANTAILTGANLQLVLNTANGLYDNVYVFNDIIDASTRTGTFASVVTNTGSVLLAPTLSYDTSNNVDLRIARVGFGAVPGLTINQTGAGNAIEAVYSPSQTGDYGTLLANLFLQTPATYAEALNQLTGAQYAGYIQSLRNNALQVSTLVSDQVDCAVTKGGIDACKDAEGGVRVWALGGFNDSRVDSNANATGYDADGTFALLGVDYTTSNFTVGAFGGYRRAKAVFDLYNGEITADGYQLGLLAGYDVGAFYIRANGSYAALDGRSRRSVGVLSTAGTISAEPDFRVTSLYGEAGARIAVGPTWATPFVGVEYTNVKMNSFTETGVGGANLAFEDQSENQTSFLIGLKWAGQLGIVIPEAKVAYRNDSNGRFFSTTQRFAEAPTGARFMVNSAETPKDSVMAGFSLAAAFTEKVTGRIGYQGRFASDLKDNAFYGSLVIRFGGK